MVWEYSKNHKNKENIMENLKYQILDGINYCQVGKITRIINSLVTVTDLITYDISINQKISNKAIEIKINIYIMRKVQKNI